MMIQPNNSLKLSRQKQEGATLISVMVFLILMTTVTVSSSKIALMDIMVASNDHKQMRNYQRTANELTELTSVSTLYEPLVERTFDSATGVFDISGTRHGVTETITDISKGNDDLYYFCQGFDGKAITIGPSAPRCYIYEFDAKSALKNTGVRDRHVRGAGKEKPNASKSSYL
jgi:hypothetical protein